MDRETSSEKPSRAISSTAKLAITAGAGRGQAALATERQRGRSMPGSDAVASDAHRGNQHDAQIQ